MGYIDNLLRGRKVEWKVLGEIMDVVTDFTAAGSFASNAANVKYQHSPDYALMVRTTDLKNKFSNKQNFVYVNEHAFHYLYRVNLNQESLVLPNVGNCGEIYHLTPQKLPWPHSVLGPNALLLKSNTANLRFLFHLFQASYFQKKLSQITSTVGQTKFNKTNLKTLPIPLPPLDVQAEIARILDRFTALEAELEAELEARQKQYEYYRDRLLTFDKTRTDVEWKTLGEVFDIRNGYTPSKKNKDYWTDGNIPWFRMEDLRLNGGILDDALQHITPQAIRGKGLFKANSIIMATTATIGEHALLIADSLANQRFTNFSIRKSLSDTLLPKFVYYYFFVLDEWCKQNVKIGNFPSVEIDRLKKQPFPLPPLAEQERIVRILDKFSTLTTSLTAGLPREIALRRRQYDYYREQLLSFE